MKHCLKCNKTKPIEEFYYTTRKIAGGKVYPSTYCKECEKKRTKKFYSKISDERKTLAVNYKGGKCVRCGYDKCLAALDFHHRDRTKKDPKMGQFSRRILTAKVKNELDKCELVCANCHREIHFEEGTNGRANK